MARVRSLVILALALIVVGVAGALATQALSGSFFWTPEVWTLDAAGVQRIEIVADSASVDLFPTPDDSIHVRLSGRRSGEQPDVRVDGDTLRIHIEHPRTFGFLHGARTLSVALPDHAYTALQAELGNGNLKAVRLRVDEVRARLDNGQVRLAYLQSDAIDLETGNGNLELNHLTGRLTAESRNGSIRVSMDAPLQLMELATNNGNIRLQTGTAPADATFDLATANGTVRVYGTRLGSTWQIVYGSGEPLIKLATRNGNIVVSE